MKLLLLSLALAVGSYSAMSLLPTQKPHLSVNGKTLCGSVVGNHVDVADAGLNGHCCSLRRPFRMDGCQRLSGPRITPFPSNLKHTRNMTFNDALPYVSFVADNALSFRTLGEAQASASMPRWKDCILVGWQCGFEPMDDEEAEELATDGLDERQWFGSDGPREPDYILRAPTASVNLRAS
jgi:hypothetical protein